MANPFDTDDFDRPTGSNHDQEINVYQQRIDDSMQSTLASTNRSMRALEESEQVGLETGKNLLIQREQLQNVDKKLGEMDGTMNQTQRHLNNIKSIFGGVKNYFSKAPPQPDASVSAKSSSSKSATKLEETVEKMSVDTSGFYNSSAGAGDSSRNVPSARIESLGGPDTRWGAMDREIDENLDLMSANLNRIRQLGAALGDEIEDQNTLVDSINDKTGRVNVTVSSQNSQMRGILGVNTKNVKK